MTTAQLVADAVATLATVWHALLVWIMLGAVVATAGLLGGIATVVWPWITAWERVTGALAASRALRAYRVEPDRYRPPQQPFWAAA